MSEPLIPGLTINLSGQNYVLPPMNVDTLEAYWDMIQGWAQPPESLMQRLGEAAAVLHAALSRNYPELTLLEVKKALDWRNFVAIIDALLWCSGLARVEPGESEAGSDLTGTKSGPESPASPAGPGSTSAGA